ncbi:MAG: hypothetical protein JOZ42_12275 [Acetobacteraceae bacterium]|nr:hypothetical protein [Acetobacteraceae bacterium]
MTNSTGTAYGLGAYLDGQPNGNDSSSEAYFEQQYNAFTKLMGVRPQYYDFYTDNGQGGAAGLAGSASWTAWSAAKTGDNYVGPGSGTIPVVGVPLSDASGQWGTVDNYYKQIISGSLDADYKGIVDAWAQEGYKTAQFRPGYEFDGTFMGWSPYSDGSAQTEADFVTAFQHVANLIHSEGNADGITAQVVWNPAAMNWTQGDVTQLYPGDQYVDIISLDEYSNIWTGDYTNWSQGGNAQIDPATWAADPVDREHFWQYMNASQYNPTPGLGSAGFSFQNFLDFAKQHNKPISLSETGAGTPSDGSLGPKDDPLFPQWLASTLQKAQAQGLKVTNVNIWSNDQSAYDFVNGERPQEAAAWAKYFGAGSGSGSSGGSGSGGSGSGGSGSGGSGSGGSGSGGSGSGGSGSGGSGSGGSGSGGSVVTLGSGAHTLALKISEDAYQGDAQFTISVDGTQIGGTQTATASHASGQSQTFDVLGNFSAGPHTFTLKFLNDLYGGKPSLDRNLYLTGSTIDGKAVPGGTIVEYGNGPHTFNFQVAASTTPPPANTLTVNQPATLKAAVQAITGTETDPTQPVYLDWRTYGAPAKGDADWVKATVDSSGHFSASVNVDHAGTASTMYAYAGTGAVQAMWTATPS